MLRRDRQRGAAAVLVASSLLLMMGLAAIVVDVGNAFGERRQAQSGVDFAALAALTAATGPNPVNAGVQEAENVVEANLPGRGLDWTSCDDPDRPAEYTQFLASRPCVSFTDNFEKARVHLPDDAVATTFGRVLGADSLTVIADAEAEQLVRLSSDIIPFTVAGDGCLYSNQAPQTVPPCDGPSDGNFGYLDVALYGNTALGTPSTCEQGNGNLRVAVNLAKGSDHNMVEYPGGIPTNDHDECENRSENVDELEVKTGSATDGISDGLIHGVSGAIQGQAFTASPGRLRATAASTRTTSVRGETLDDTPLWDFLNPAGVALCGTVTDRSEMKSCLDGWDASDGDIFIKGLEDHMRFAAVPVFTIYPADPTAGGSQAYTIARFAPVYIETIFMDCNAQRCKTIFSPGESGGGDSCPDPLSDEPDTTNCGHGESGNPNDKVEGLAALVMEIEMLHPDSQEFFPGTLEGRELRLYK